MFDTISIVIGVFCILLVTVFRSQFKGKIGEMVSAKFLNKLDKDKYRVLNDIKIDTPSNHTKTSQIDHLVVSKYGIFVVETKAYKGKIYGKEYSRNWTQYLGSKKYEFMNPILQNYGHIKALEALLEEVYPNMKYFSIIAFSPEANLKDVEVKDAKLCKISQVGKLIESLSTEEVHSEDDLEKIVGIIKSNKSYQTDFSHVMDINKIKKENEKKIEEGICPKCGGKLIEREGKYGKFLGCSNFPKCRFVVSGKKDK
ncbi:NERD domain-containing protein [uncultured Anaerococcus sp.]|uniref:NERD domain-containing protein n=1 Tax=uncultured Anaerococcus sp. TaxID=293428 RepID=UPI00288B9121|nr:NERD domain-containing protein [uncultured Anaerococcus sp.]